MSLQNVASLLEGTKYGRETAAIRFIFYGPSDRQMWATSAWRHYLYSRDTWKLCLISAIVD